MNTTFVTLSGVLEESHLAHLARDLERREIALESHLAGGAERALECAARLRGDAERESGILGDRDRLDLLAVGQLEEELLRPVGGALMRRDREPRHGEVLVELRPERSRQFRHRREIAGRILPKALRDLAAAVRRLALSDREIAQLSLGDVGEKIQKIRFVGHPEQSSG